MARSVAGTAPRTNRKFLIVAILFGALTAALFYALTARTDESTGTSSRSSAGDASVVVAVSAIRQRTRITADMLEVRSVPGDVVAAGAFSSLESVVGKVTRFPIEANQQVVTSAVVDTERPIVGDALTLVVPDGRRAMSIQASQVISAGGLILPGDYVDLIWGCCAGKLVATSTLLQNVQVAAVAQNIVNSGPVPVSEDGSDNGEAPVQSGDEELKPDAATITLLLTPEESQKVFLAEQTGTIRAVLRNIGDQNTAPVGATIYTDIVPIDAINRLPDALKPDGFKPGQQ